MKHPLRITTINLCAENPMSKTTLIKKWIDVLLKLKVDILFIQEIFNIEKFATDLGMKLLNIDHGDGICVLINPNKLVIIDNNNVKLHSDINPIYIGGMHLDDIPSLSHHMINMIYKSSEIIPLSLTMKQLLKLCAKRRLPRLQEELKSIKNADRAIIAGDFNEPSHLDLDNIQTPCSNELAKNGFIDTYRHMHGLDKSGYTWPAGQFYKNEPDQRIDFIYTKNVEIVSSDIYGEGSKWISDHKMLITDILV
jgi:endonuclease/exonuclease/phosphatase family metal-dependent hydrolase